MPHSHGVLLMVALVALLQACASPLPALKDSEWQQHQARLQGLERWQFNGKVAIRTDDMADTARLQWIQREQQTQLELSGPMGWNRFTLLMEGEKLTLFQDGQWQALSGPEQLEEMIGWDLPVDQLRWWVKGLPAPGQRIELMELEDGRLSLLQQGGWQLSYDGYRQAGDWILPASIRFEQTGIRGKILLKEWEPEP